MPARRARRRRYRDRRRGGGRQARSRGPLHARAGSGLEIDPPVVLELHLGPGMGVAPVDLPLVVAYRRPGKEPDSDPCGELVDAVSTTKAVANCWQ